MTSDSRYSVLNAMPQDFFRLIPQAGVSHVFVTEEPTHNAIWDMVVSPDKTIFFSVCGESYAAEYARLYEYIPQTGELKAHFKLEDKLIHQEQPLRTSKLHTAMSFLEDGRMISTTHTTSPSPNHPMWMPYQYANHQWEGYQGSNIIVYDPKTGRFENKGVISPFDTTYGGNYDPKNGDYFCTTWMTGTGYVYNIHTGEHRCLGQVSDTATSRTFRCSDGHIYGSTYSGLLFRYNTDRREIEYLDADIGALMRHAVEIDGTLYITTGPCAIKGRGQELFSYTLATGELRRLGRPVPEIACSDPNANAFMNAYGMAADSQGRLWYGCMTYVAPYTYCGARLFMWDVRHGKAPVDFGFLGSPARTVSITAEMRIVDDVLYVSDGNHIGYRDDCCGLMIVDLKKTEAAFGREERPFSHDFMNYLPYPSSCAEVYPLPDYEEKLRLYDARYNEVLAHAAFQNENWFRCPDFGAAAVSFWRETGRENAAVRRIDWTDNDHLSIRCGADNPCRIDAACENGVWHVTNIVREPLPDLTAPTVSLPEDIILPAIAGRRYLAQPEAVAVMDDGLLVGTRDTMLARIRGNHVFSLGSVCPCGGVHALAAAPDKRTVYGVCGYPMGIGTLFSYSDTDGVRQLGLIPTAFAENGRNVCIYHPTVLAMSPDGKRLAVGGTDELAGVVILSL